MVMATEPLRGRRHVLAALVVSLVISGAGLVAPGPASAATATVPLSPSSTVVPPTVLLAASGDLAGGASVVNPTAYPKHFWVSGFNSGTQTVTWSVSSESAADFHVDLLVDGPVGAVFSLKVNGSPVLQITKQDAAWSRITAGTIAIPAGTSSLTLSRTSGGSGTASVKSIELVSSASWAGFQQKVSDFKLAGAATRDEFSQSGLGLMFQYGPWSYPASGANPGLEDHTNAFDVEAFADLVQSTGAGHVIWSISWWTYQMQAPISAVDTVVGNGNRTASRDLIGELAQEFQSRGIMFMLYYHVGQDEHLGYQSTDFWQAQNWPNSFTSSGTGDRSTMFTNWQTIVTQIGNRYGTLLDGWFFDDALVYYPADFEQLGAAARAGNPARLVSWNSWIAPGYTQFQDVVFGEEGCLGGTPIGAAANGGNGVMTAGKHAGELEHCMNMLEQDWGVRAANQAISTQLTAQQLAAPVAARLARNAPVSLNLMMHYPGVPAASSMAVLSDLNALLIGTETRKNDTDGQIAYSANQWTHSTNRGAGDFQNDVTYATANGASFEYAFTGTAVDIVGPVDGQVNADVFIDGTKVLTVNRTAASYTPQALLASLSGLTPGAHTVKVVKTGGQYLQLDALEVRTPRANNSDSAIAYSSGQWTAVGNRGAGDFQDDVTYATANGASFEYAFSGTGVDVIAPVHNTTSADVYIDGTLVASVNRTDPAYVPQVTLASITNLSPGQHVLKVVKTGGQYLQLDALLVRAPRVNNTASGLVFSSNQWTTVGNRNSGDFQNDVTYATANGAWLEYTFTGTGVDVIGPAQDVTQATVLIDGVQVATINRSDTGYSAQVALASVRNLTPGTHVVRVVKTGGTYFQVDAMQIFLD